MRKRNDRRFSAARPWWFADDDLAHLFGYANKTSLQGAMRNGSFPLPCRKIGESWCVDKYVVANWFKDYRFESSLLYEDFLYRKGYGD